MGLGEAVLAIILIAILIAIAIAASRRSAGGLAPANNPPPEPKTEGGTTYELGGVCQILSSTGQPGEYRKIVFPDSRLSTWYSASDVRLEQAPAGIEVRLKHQFFVHRTLRQEKPSTAWLKQGGSTSEFNGEAGLLSSRQSSNDFIVWIGDARKTDPNVPFPESIEICMRLKKET